MSPLFQTIQKMLGDDPESRSLRAFIVSASLAAALCVSCGFLGMAIRDRNLIHQEMLNRARRDFANIVLMRQWNASYGGVFVEKKPGVVSNPYLENPDITATDGRVYTKKNPALMTRELSEMLQKSQGYFFHITSLKPINPGNAPDPQETEALQAFEQGTRERYWTETVAGQPFYRYMAPLMVDASCLVCHAKQGYKVGDIRGGISVSVLVREVEQQLRTNLLAISGLALLTTALLLASILLFFRQLVRKLIETRQQLRTLATTDPLTGLFNRRHLMTRFSEELERRRREKQPLSCILVDVDHFKHVNDHCGHLAGDEVLKEVTDQLRAGVRLYDVLGRYGGEEFLAALPGTDLPTALAVAERLRQSVEREVAFVLPDGTRSPVTISLGVTQYKDGDTLERLVNRADAALYRAKEEGRNRVVTED